MWRVLLVFGLLFFAPTGVLASEDEVLNLPIDEFPLIPGNMGMRFFEGVWRPHAWQSQLVSKTFTVTDRTISWDDIDDVSPYRVLAARENYVLLASYDRVGVTEYVYWTTFVILHLQIPLFGPERSPEQTDMAYNYCTDYRLKNGETGYRLPKAALLRIFATSLCRKDILDYFKHKNRSHGVIAWGSGSFARNAFADGSWDWLVFQRNEKLRGAPPASKN